ncbi:response regulator transcription factor [Paenibacillus yanchengensis]|uniref:Response regulator n=1 Tax=Paenibacillus yanchengensis TaxID=2035833 RepID=A0ABW4YHR8_9BACL
MENKPMYHVVIAEDEPLILDHIVQKISQATTQFQIVGTAHDGSDALALIKQYEPDILFTDIQMPEMDGLSLAALAKQICPHLEVVIISGYNDFSYAQQAIRIGVSDYLLKPIKMEQLEAIVTDITQRLNKRLLADEQRMVEEALQGGKFRGKPLSTVDSSWKAPLQLISITLGNLYTYAPDLLDMDYFHRLWAMIDWDKLLHNSNLPLSRWWMTEDISYNQRFLIIRYAPKSAEASNEDKIEYKVEHKAQIAAFSAHIQTTITNYLLQSMSVTVSTTITPTTIQLLRDNARTIRHALERSSLCCTSSLLFVTDDRIEQQPAPKDIAIEQVQINALKLLMKEQQLVQWQQQLRQLLLPMMSEPITQRHLEMVIQRLAQQLLASLEADTSMASQLLAAEIIETIAAATEPEQLATDTIQIFLSHISPLLQTRKKSTDTSEQLYQQIAQFIQTNMSKPITVSMIADHFNFNSSYIIRVFKRYSGEPPMKYLTTLRVEHAKQLMIEQPELDIKHIAEVVGYPEQQYFSRVFKNATGLSPTEFRG